MAGRGDGKLGKFEKVRAASDYTLSDPTLSAYDHRIGTLRFDGEIKGYVASVVGEIRGPGPRGPWPWFVVVWTDGTKESPFEDYGPKWWTVRELDSGCFDHYEQGATRRRRFLGTTSVTTTRGLPRKYDFAWLSINESTEKWKELKLEDSDF